MATILSEHSDPGAFAEECEFLPTLIGEFTDAVMSHVRLTHADARFEVLYPPDVNDTPLNRLVNFPHAKWTPAVLECLKTENFTYTGESQREPVLRLPSKCRCSWGLDGGKAATWWGLVSTRRRGIRK